jgi:DNA-binding XRE family transcriptional regulator
MPRPKRDNSAVEPEMKRRAIEFSTFRQDNNLSQKLLAEVIGISRRTVQSIEAASILPQKATLKKFEELRVKYEAEGKPGGRKKTRAA